MKTITLILAVAALLAAQTQQTQPTQAATKAATPRGRQPHQLPAQPQKPAAPQNAASQPPTVPAGATELEPNLYRYTDAQGKTWLYRKTPFGVSKWEDTPAPQPVVKEEAPVTVTDLGDRFQFERKTPFGASKWVRKKDELTSEEKALVTSGRQALAQSEIETAEKP